MRRLLPALALALTSCSFVVGAMQECETDADCAQHGTGLTCSDSMCVDPSGNDPSAARCKGTLGIAGKDSITLAALLPFTTGDGTPDARGQARANAVQLAVEEINQRQGVNGRRPFELVVCDTSGDGAIAKRVASYVIKQRAVPAILSAGSSETLAIAAESIPAGVLLVSASATSPEITGMVKKRSGDPASLVWRVCPSDAIQGKVISEELKRTEDVATSRVAILATDDPYGQGLSQVFSSAYPGKTGTFLFTKDQDPSAAVEQAVEFKPTVALFIGFPVDAKAVLAKVVAGGPLATSKWFFTDSAKSVDVFQENKDKDFLEGSRGTAPATLSSAAYTSFRSRYQSRFGADPDATSYTAHNYDAVYLLALAASWAAGEAGEGEISGVRMAQGMTRLTGGEAHQLQPLDYVATRSAFEAGKDLDVEGASGKLDFDSSTGEAPSKIELWSWTAAGGIKTLSTVDPPP